VYGRREEGREGGRRGWFLSTAYCYDPLPNSVIFFFISNRPSFPPSLLSQASTLVMLLLHLAAASFPPPAHYPHLFSLLFSVFSALCLGLLLVYINVRQWLVR